MADDRLHNSQSNASTGTTVQPDAPFRSGITGKYKLLIKNVAPKFGSYEYDLVDAEGKEYKANAKQHYADGQILRCMVTFVVSNAKLVVTDTAICSKQDFATAIPEPPKPQPKPQPKAKKPVQNSQPKTKSKAKKTQPCPGPKKVVLGDPKHRKTSSTYLFRVVSVEKNEDGYAYVVEGANGQEYVAKSKNTFSVGDLVDCKANVSLSPGGVLKVTIKSIRAHISVVSKPHKRKKSNPLKHWHAGGGSRDWFGGPNVGDHFHLIYTPMGNKR